MHSSGTATFHSSASTSKASNSNSSGGFDLTKFLFNEQKVASTALACKAKRKEVEHAEEVVYKYSSADSRAMRVYRILSDPYTDLTCLFLQSAIAVFDDVNRILQKEEPCIHILHSVLLEQLKSLLMRFVKPACHIRNLQCNCSAV